VSGINTGQDGKELLAHSWLSRKERAAHSAALSYLRETASLLQDAANNHNNTIVIGALIYVKAQCPF
jgi:hypothetical protein